MGPIIPNQTRAVHGDAPHAYAEHGRNLPTHEQPNGETASTLQGAEALQDERPPMPETQAPEPSASYLQIALRQGRPQPYVTSSGRVSRSIDDMAIDYGTHPTPSGAQTHVVPAKVDNRYMDRAFADAHQSAVATRLGKTDYHLMGNGEHDFLKSGLRLHNNKAGALETSILKKDADFLNHMDTRGVDFYFKSNQDAINHILSPKEQRILQSTLNSERTLNGNNAALASDLIRYLVLAVEQSKGNKILYQDFDASRAFQDVGRINPMRVRKMNADIGAGFYIGRNDKFHQNNDQLGAVGKGKTIDFSIILRRSIELIEHDSPSKSSINTLSVARVRPHLKPVDVQKIYEKTKNEDQFHEEPQKTQGAANRFRDFLSDHLKLDAKFNLRQKMKPFFVKVDEKIKYRKGVNGVKNFASQIRGKFRDSPKPAEPQSPIRLNVDDYQVMANRVQQYNPNQSVRIQSTVNTTGPNMLKNVHAVHVKKLSVDYIKSVSNIYQIPEGLQLIKATNAIIDHILQDPVMAKKLSRQQLENFFIGEETPKFHAILANGQLPKNHDMNSIFGDMPVSSPIPKSLQKNWHDAVLAWGNGAGGAKGNDLSWFS